jgi:hypothetical protein
MKLEILVLAEDTQKWGGSKRLMRLHLQSQLVHFYLMAAYSNAMKTSLP